MSDVKEPQSLPGGPYIFRVLSHEHGEQQNEKKTPFISFALEFEAPAPGNDADLTEVSLPKTINHKFYITPDALYRLSLFLAAIGLPDVSLEEGISMAQGRRGIANVKQVPSRKPGETRMYNDIDSFAGVE
jgi:hypothetical protein